MVSVTAYVTDSQICNSRNSFGFQNVKSIFRANSRYKKFDCRIGAIFGSC